VKITQEQLDKLYELGACSDSMARYSAGMDVSKVRWLDALWVEKHAPNLVADIDPPLWTRCLSGYGDGYGYGDGGGDGDGYGYGDGFGYGDGYGYGYGGGYGWVMEANNE